MQRSHRMRCAVRCGALSRVALRRAPLWRRLCTGVKTSQRCCTALCNAAPYGVNAASNHDIRPAGLPPRSSTLEWGLGSQMISAQLVVYLPRIIIIHRRRQCTANARLTIRSYGSAPHTRALFYKTWPFQFLRFCLASLKLSSRNCCTVHVSFRWNKKSKS